MKMDQPTNEVKGSGSTISPALEAHLDRLHSFAVKAMALADDAEFQETSIEIATALSSITSAIAHGLDTPQRFEVAV